MLQLQPAREDLEPVGIRPLIVTFEAEDAAREYVVETGLSWPLLVDRDRRLYRTYHMHRARLRDLWGIATMRAYWREARNGRFPRLPRADTRQQGGNVLIDSGGIVRFHHVGLGPADRPLVKTLLTVAAGLAGGVDD